MFKGFLSVLHLAWHFLGDFFRLVGGVWKLSKLEGPVVSIFGGSKFEQSHPSAGRAHELAQKLIEQDILLKEE